MKLLTVSISIPSKNKNQGTKLKKTKLFDRQNNYIIYTYYHS